jgi:hypothetical protein
VLLGFKNGGTGTHPLLGTRITLRSEITPLERDTLLGASVDVAIGLRPYIAAMS